MCISQYPFFGLLPECAVGSAIVPCAQWIQALAVGNAAWTVIVDRMAELGL